MRKRITSLLLTLVMLLSLVPAMGVTASAADGFVEVSTYEQLKTAVDKGDAKVKLMANIDTTNENGGAGVTQQAALTFIGDGNILDLNGYTLKLVSNTGATFFEVLKSLTIKDSGTDGRIDFKYGSNVMHRTTAIHVADASTANLTVESGTLSSTESSITLIESEGNLTINGGKFYAPYREGSGGTYAIHTIHQYNDNAKTIINGGEIDGVVLIQRDDSAATGTPNYGDIPVQIKGGTFKQHVLFRWTEKGKPSGDPTEFSPAVEIAGGIFEKPVNRLSGIWGVDLSTKLTGGTFKDFPNSFGLGRGGKSDHEYYSKSLGNSIIMRGNEIRTSCDWSEADWFKVYFDSFYLDGSESNPVTVIPNAWGMKSVTLDGDSIDYAKDFKGEVKEITNSTAHTLTFEWNSLADELVKAGYSYDAKCEHYISGLSGVQQTDTIAAGKTSHTITIKKGEEPKVYSYDLQLRLQKDGSSVGIMGNEHIVKLVVNQAPVVKPDPTIEGSVYYTSGIVYGSPISVSASVTPAEATKSYQWQRSTNGGSDWTNIDGATSGRYTPVAADMGENVRIRVKVTAEGYLGEIIGAALKVSKADNNNTPAPPAVAAQQDDSGAYKKFVISDFNSDQEYVYTTSAPTSGNEWPTGTPITSATVEGLTEGSTYYIFTRYKETATHTAGSKISSSSVLLDDVTKLNRIILTDESGKEYSSYGSGNTIYIEKGKSVTLTATTNPDGANTWNSFKFKPKGVATSSHFTVIAPTDPVASGTIPSVTIRGDEAGTDTLAAEYSGYTPQYYGTWTVHVYENVSDIGTGAEITVSSSFPDTTMYQGETMPLPEHNISVYPEGALDNYNLAWRIIKTGMGATYPMSDANITLEDDQIKATASHTAPNKTRIELVAINKTNDEDIRSFSPSIGFYVTVTDAPTIELTGVTVAPTKVNLANVNDTCQLSAVKEPVNATGSLTWVSDKPGIATVSVTGEVKAVAAGTAIITVSCGDKKATCTVTVAHTHDTGNQSWAPLNDYEHYRNCTAGDDPQFKPHSISSWADKGDGTHTGTCTDCHYVKTENHSWKLVGEVAPTVDMEGSRSYECSATDCTATRTESIPKLIEYTVTVKDDGNGKASADHIKAVAGTEIKLTATANSGYHFKEWQVVTGSVTINDNKFTMPDGNVEVKAIFEKNTSTGGGGGGGGVTTYAITVKSAKNGDVTASHKTASKGTAVTLTVDPDKGYVLDTLTVLDGKDKEIKLTEKNGKYTFTMPASKVTVAATFKASAPTGKNPFIDVPAGSYYEDAVVWAVEKGITSGTSAVTFDPNGNCTRAQAVTFLWRAAGSPAPKTKVMPFTDVPSGSYYYDAVLWAMEQGITKGTSDTMFSPDATCTRAQIVTFLWRANGSPAVSGNSAFTDVAADAYYAAAVKWAEKNGVTGGIGGGLFGSNNNCTRAQIVTFIYRSVK